MDGEFCNVQTQAKQALGARVLLIAASHTGNNVFCTPAIRFLKKHYPQTEFDVVAMNKLSAEVFLGHPDIHRLIVTSQPWRVRWLARGYDRVICLNYKSRHLVRHLRQALHVIPPLPEGLHHAEQMLRFVAGLIQQPLTDADRAYVLVDTQPQSEARIKQWLPEVERSYVGIHLGCGRTSIHGWKFFYKHRATHEKLWPVDHYITLAQRLVEANPAIRIVITGTSNEAFLGKTLVQAIPDTINLIGKTSVADLNQLMRRLDLFIAHDCALLHLASASSVPLVGLFGPTDPVHTGPYPLKPNHTVIKQGAMPDITVEAVVKAASHRLIRRI